MENWIDEHMVANQISLLRDVYRGTILVVEGADDGRLMERFAAREDRCRVVPANGKRSALGALALLRKRGMSNFVCVVLDADFWNLSGETPDDSDVMVTDFHDLEMDIAMSDAFDTLLREIADTDLVVEFERHHGTSTRQALLRILQVVGLLRFANYQHGLFLRFRNTELEDYIHEESLEVDVNGFISAVLDDSHPGVDHASVKNCTSSFEAQDADLPQLVRGHDLASLLGVALRKTISARDRSVGCREHVESMLRLAFGRECFERTNLFSSILAWERKTGGLVLE